MLSWTAHPAARRPKDAMLVACVITLAAYAILTTMRSPWLAVIAAIFLVTSTAPFLFRTHYTLDATGITERRGFATRARAWSELRRLEVGRDVARVSPYAQRRWLDRYRGFTIYFDGGDRAAIVRALEEHLGTGRTHA